MRGPKHQHREGKAATYKQHNRVERLVNRLQNPRAIAARYEKLAARFLALVNAALNVVNS